MFTVRARPFLLCILISDVLAQGRNRGRRSCLSTYCGNVSPATGELWQKGETEGGEPEEVTYGIVYCATIDCSEHRCGELESDSARNGKVGIMTITGQTALYLKSTHGASTIRTGAPRRSPSARAALPLLRRRFAQDNEVHLPKPSVLGDATLLPSGPPQLTITIGAPQSKYGRYRIAAQSPP